MAYDSGLIAGKCALNLKIVKDITDGQSLELSKTVKFLKIGLEMRTGRPDSHKYLIHPRIVRQSVFLGETR